MTHEAPQKLYSGRSALSEDALAAVSHAACGGRLIVIDGGFCKACQATSGIAGYTLISTSRSFRIVAHQPFVGRETAIRENHGIASSTEIFERQEYRQRISDTDIGRDLRARIDDLRFLLDAYRDGVVTEDHRG